MKTGMNLYLWTHRLEPGHFALFEPLRAAGFDGVEIPMSDYSAAELASIRTAISNAGLSCTMATLLTAEVNPISADARTRTAALDKIRRDLEISHALGAETLVGPVHSGHKVFPGRGPTAQEFDWCVDFLQAAAREAAAANVAIAVEPLNRFECYFLNLQADARRLADAVDHTSVGILYDTHHANIEENNIHDAVTGLGDRLIHFHVSESHRGTPGTGTVDWKTNFEALRELDYEGWVVIEAFATDVEGIPTAINIWRDCFTSKEVVYRDGIALIRSHTQ